VRKHAEARLKESERRLQELLAAIPAAIYTTDEKGRITYFNQTAVEFAGRTPMLGSDDWCVTWKLYMPDGTPLPHDQCPMAVALKEGRPVRGVEAVAERPDGTRVPFIPFPTPLRDPSGRITGAINMLVDLSERKQAETQQHLLLNELNHRTKNNMQVMQSLLLGAARAAKSEEARRVLEEASGRIAAMAAAQRVLYGTTDANRFSADQFLGAVVETVQQTLPVALKILRAPATGVLSNDTAMPLALILNELLTNAAKHGVKDPENETVRVRLAENDGRFELHVEDDGPGFDLDAIRRTSSGLRLVLGLARQLQADFQVTRAPSRASVCFAAVRSA
jgi:PAS domain S-box-containing protein